MQNSIYVMQTPNRYTDLLLSLAKQPLFLLHLRDPA